MPFRSNVPGPLIAALALTCSSPPPAHAAPAACAGIGRPAIRADISGISAGVQYDLSKSPAGIAALNPGYRPGDIDRGLTTDDFRAGYDVDFRMVPVPGGLCAVPVAIRGYAGYAAMTVYIDRSYPAGSCQSEAIRKHENLHVAINRRTLRDAMPRMAAALEAASAGPAFPVFAPDPDRAREAGMAAFRPGFERELASFQRAREIANGNLDSPGSYAATTRSCPWW